MLSFQKLAAYQYAIQFVGLALEVIQDLPRGHADDADQNIAEGAGKLTFPDKVKHDGIARGEAVESACSLDVMRLEKTITEEPYARGMALLEGVTATLSDLIDRPGRSGSG